MINNVNLSGASFQNRDIVKPEKVLIVATAADKLQLTDGVQMETGFWAEELIEPMRIFKSAGFGVDVATLGGKKPPADPTSLNPNVVGKEKSEEYRKTLDSAGEINNPVDLEKMETGNLKDYSAIFVVGGHGVLADLANSKKMGELLSAALHNPAQVVSAVCHGPAVFKALKLVGEDQALKGVPMTGFSEEEEAAANLKGKVPFELEPTLKEMGAAYSQTDQLFSPYVVEGGQAHASGDSFKFITGQNPASSAPVAEKIVDNLKNLYK